MLCTSSSAAPPSSHDSSMTDISRCQTQMWEPLAPNEVEYLVALLLHQLLRARFEIQSQQRLRVRRTHVEMPVAGVYRDPVEMRDLALGRISLLQLLQLQRGVRHRGVQLAGDEVLGPERGENLRELSSVLRDQLEHQQERDDAGIGLRELAEVVVAGHLAAECRMLLAHAVL